MATGASDNLFFRGVYEGCLGGCDGGIERRPYHRNCKCALHKSRDQCLHGGMTKTKVSYPIRRSWSEGCSLALMASAQSSPSSSPATSLGRSRLFSSNNLADEDYDVSSKV